MDEDLVRLYEAELTHLRSHAAEFAKRGRFQRIAARLGLDAPGEARDPFVEWLLQGYAFLAARVQRKLEAEFPRFTQNLLSVVYPHLAAPTPSMIVAEFALKPDPGLLGTGVAVPREARMELAAGAGAPGRAAPTAVIFTTGRAVRLWPVAVREARYLPDAASVSSAGASRAAPAALAVTLELTPAEADLSAFGADELDLFVDDGEGAGPALMEAAAFASGRVEIARAGAGAPALSVRALGLDRRAPFARLAPDEPEPDEIDALLPYGHRSFDGYRLLHEYFSFPARFRFLRLSGLKRALAGREGRRIELLFLLDRPFPELVGKLAPELLRPNCAPAANLFRHLANDIPLRGGRTEHQILPDRRASSYEVHSVLAARGSGSDGSGVNFRPFFHLDGLGAPSAEGRRYYHVVRRARARPALREDRDQAMDLHPGSEAFVSILDAAGRPTEAGVKALSLDLLCTNRHLPEHLMLDVGAATRLTSELDLGWREIRVAAGPSAPRKGLTEGRRLWDVISHLSLNYLSLVGDGAEGRGDAAAALRQLMRIYAPEKDERANALIDALVGVSAAPAVRRASPLHRRPGDAAAPLAFVRGVEARLAFDERARDAALLAAVLDRVLAGHADANAFVETALTYPDGRVRLRWAARTGARPLL